MASADQSVNMKVMVPISASDIGLLIGPKGSSLKNHVIRKSANIYKADHGSEIQENLDIRVKISIEDDKVMASISSVTQELCDIIAKNLEKHAGIFLSRKNASQDPTKPKVCKFVFKTNMESGLQGKYVGYKGKNIIGTRACCTEALRESNVDVSSIRLNISDDRFLHKNSYDKLYFIKSGATTDNNVLISFSAIYPGNPHDIFKVIKPIIIDSVINMFAKEEPVTEFEMDFLCSGSVQDPVGTAARFLESLGDPDTPEPDTPETDEDGCYVPPIDPSPW